MRIKKSLTKDTLNEEEIIDLLNKARYFHNYIWDEHKAIRLCNTILEHEPENRDAMLVKAGALRTLSKEKEAMYLVKKIIEKWPEYWEAYYLMGFLLFDANEDDDAMSNFIKSMALQKNFDNTIASAQTAYLMRDERYKEYLRYAKHFDPVRYNNYMKRYWEW